MPIENTGPIRLRGAAGDGRTDINEEINGNVTDTDVSLGTLNTSAFTNVADGTTVSGRSMSEMRGYAAFESLFPSTEADGALGESIMTGGTNEYFRRTNSLSGNSKIFTLSFWIKINKVDTAYKTLLSAGDGGTDRAYFFFYNKKFHIYEYNGSSYTLQHEVDQIIDTSGWYHFVLAFDTTKDYAPDRTRVYINGIEVSLITTTSYDKNDESYIGRNNTFAIGYDYGLGSRFFPGVIADFKFIDGKQLRPDSFGELVQGIWIPKAFNTASTDTLVTSNRYIDFRPRNQSDISGSTITNNGSLGNGTLESGIDLLQNNYGILNLTTSEKISGTSWNLWSTSTDNTDSTVEFWINIDTAFSSGFATLIGANGGSSGESPYRLLLRGYGSNQYFIDQFRMFGSNNYYTNPDKYPRVTLLPNTWYHIVGTYTAGSNKILKAYLNGNLIYTDTASTISYSNSYASSDFAINQYRAGNPLGLDGKYGDIRVYSAALTEAEVLQNYNATKHYYTYGLNGFWLPLNNTSTGSIVDDSSLKLHLDASDSSSYSGSGTDWLDLTANNYDATLVSSPNYLTGNGGAFEFDGSNDHATLNSAAETAISALSKGTIEVWARPDSVTSGPSIRKTMFSAGSTSSADRWVTFRIRSGNGLQLNINNDGAGFGAETGGSNYGTLNEWNHYVVTYDGGSSYKMYINGVSQSITVTGYAWFDDIATDTLDIAKLYRGSSNSVYDPFDGEIAQVRVYDKALTAQEVIANYRATQGNYEQVSTVDISGNANSFTSTNIDYTDHIPDEPLDNRVTFDPNNLWGTGSPTLSDGSKVYKSSSTAEGFVTTTKAMPRNGGKYYFEMKSLAGTGHGVFGITDTTKFSPRNSGGYNPADQSEGFYVYNRSDNLADIYKNGASLATDAFAFAISGGVVAFAIDTDNDKYWTGYASGGSTTWYNSGDPAAGTNETSSALDYDFYMPFTSNFSAGSGRYQNTELLCDNDEIVGAAPTGFKLLSFNNLPAPAFDPDGATPDKPSNYFKAVTYQGNGGTQGEAYGYKDGSRAAVFNGSSSAIDTGSTLLGQTYSVSLWFNAETITTNTEGDALYAQYNSANAGRHIVGIYTDNLRIFVGGQTVQTISATWSTNTWTHLVVVKNSSGYEAFVNGSSIGTSSLTSNIDVVSNTTIGAEKSTTPNYSFPGKIDEVRIFDKALSSTEVGYLADDDTTNIDAISNLVAHYDMEGDANDSSGYALVDNHYFFVSDAGNLNSSVRVNSIDSEFTYTRPSGYDEWGGAFDPNNVAHQYAGSSSYTTLSESNKKWDKSGSYYNTIWSTNKYNSGKYYFELEFLGAELFFGIIKTSTATTLYDGNVVKENSISYGSWNTTSFKYSITNSSEGQTLSTNDVIGFAVDFDNLELKYYRNNTLIDTSTIASSNYNGTPTNVTYTQDKPYGNIDVGFAPDLVWVKERNSTSSHGLHDSVRGATKFLNSNNTNAEGTNSAGLTSFDSNGFSVGSAGYINESSSRTYVAWAWKAGGAAVSNTDGTITSTVSSNPDAGFSIVDWDATTTGSDTIGHGLDNKPELVIMKNRSNSNRNWFVFTDIFDGSYDFLYLNETNSKSNSTRNVPTADVFDQGNLGGVVAGDNCIAYCFHSVDGFSKIGSYTGNGSSDGPFIYTGFKPAFVLIKNTSSAYNWYIRDNVRNTTNPVDSTLAPNTSSAEDNGWSNGFDFLSNGFKINLSSVETNENNSTFIYIAFAEDPVKYSNGVATLGDGNEFIQDGNYPEDNFTTNTWTSTGDNSDISIKTGFKPDFVWVKSRTDAYNHTLYDSVRGAGVNHKLMSSLTNSESSLVTDSQNYGYLGSFDTDGFTGKAGSIDNSYYNYSTNKNYVSWSWKAAGNANTYNILENGTVTSSASASTLGLDTGTITPSGVSANRDNGFSIVKYTGNGTAGSTVGHGLSKPPEMIILKNTTDSVNWFVWTKDLGGGDKLLELNTTTNTKTTTTPWNSTTPSSTVFTVGTNNGSNGLNDDIIAYCWYSVPGFSKIGSYTGGSGEVDVYTGFEPAWVMIKNTNNSGTNWVIFDNKRDVSNPNNAVLYANTNDDEENPSTAHIDIFSNKFQINNTTSYSLNNNGAKYIYMAFAHR